MPTQPGKNLRNASRIYLRPPWFRSAMVSYRDAHAEIDCQGLLHSLSSNGLFVKTSLIPALRSRVRLTFKFAGQPFECEGEVIYLNPLLATDHEQGFGVKFTHIDPHDRQSLQSSIDRALAPYLKSNTPLPWL